MSAAGLQRVELDVASPSKNLVGHEAEITLPNVNRIHAPNGSVMWAEPDPKGAGARRAGPYEPAKAVDVTSDPAAKQSGEGGASIAAGRATTATPATHHGHRPQLLVTEASREDDAFSNTKLLSDARSSLSVRSHASMAVLNAPPKIGQSEAVEIVASAKAHLRDEEAARRVRRDTPASAKTIADYERKCRQVDAEMGALVEPWGDRLEQVMCRHAPIKQTFYAVRSALKWRALTQLQHRLDELEALRLEVPGPAACLRSVESLRVAVCTLKSVLALNRENCLQLSDQKPRTSRSKKKLFPRLKEGWQDRFLSANESSPTYRMAGVLLRHLGLRPVELENGVELKRTATGIQVQIVGGKVRSTAGQPLRSFTLRADMLPAWFVKQVEECEVARVRVDPDRLRRHLARLTERVFGLPCRATDLTGPNLVLSAYLFRHSIVTELRQAGWATQDIASVIGESSSATVRFYGIRSRPNAKTPKTVALMRDSIQVARPVRSVDRSGLNVVLAAKAKKKICGKSLRP